MLRLGIISDAHGHILQVRKLVSLYNKEEVDAVLVPGDICRLGNQKRSVRAVLNALKKCKSKVYLMPGGHEGSDAYRLVRRSSFTDCTRKRKVKINGFPVVFLPGSDFIAREGSFVLISGVKNLKSRKRRLESLGVEGLEFFSVSELRRLVSSPRTLVVSHVPPRYSTDHGLDVATSGIVTRAFRVPEAQKGKLRDFAGMEFSPGNVIVLPAARHFARAGFPVSIRTRHVGNRELKKVLRSLGVHYFVCGHIHESGQRAVTATGRRVRSGQWSRTLYLNAGAAKDGRSCILFLDQGKASFRKVKV